MIAKPEWLVVKAPNAQVLAEMENLFKDLSLETVCQNAHCPNLGECFNAKTATLMILGNICTRRCGFCAVAKGIPFPANQDEPLQVAKAVGKLGLKHAVITSVTRDDLSDGGSGHFAQTISNIRALNPTTTIEALIPDFQGNAAALKKVIEAKPEIINHNIETVGRLYAGVRPQASYERSLKLLETIKSSSPEIFTKSGIMLGLGETGTEVIEAFRNLQQAGCDILTIGQYLCPSKQHIPVNEYIPPEKFAYYKLAAQEMGFRYVASGPFVRSSYKAHEGLEHFLK